MGAFTAFFTIASLIPTSRAAAQDESRRRTAPIRIDVELDNQRVRSQGPIALTFQLVWDSPQLLEGRLHLELRDGTRVLAHVTSHDVALSLGSQRMRFVLPAFRMQNTLGVLTVVPRFKTTETEFELKPFDVRVPVWWQRAGLVALVAAEHRDPGTEQTLLLTLDLRLEQFAGDLATRKPYITTTASNLRPDDVPATAAALCVYDLVILTDGALQELREGQLTALADWIDAGGSAYIVTGDNLESRHVEFLNRLAGSEHDAEATGPRYAIDDRGRLQVASVTGPDTLQLDHCGWGRVVMSVNAGLAGSIGRSSPASDIEQQQWRRIVCFLWKVRASQTDELVNYGAAEWTVTEPEYEWDREVMWQPGPSSHRAELPELLQPQSVQPLPFTWVAGILVLFLLAIAPGDYFLLGLVKKRVWTWVLFPATSIAFTVFTVMLAGHFVGSTDYRNSLFIVDLGETGRVVRTSQFQQAFTATERTVTTNVRQGLYSPFGSWTIRKSNDDEFFGRRTGSLGTRAANDAGQVTPDSAYGAVQVPVTFAGYLPMSYDVEQRMRKWSPRMSRITSFAVEDPPTGHRLPIVTAADLADPSRHQSLLQRIRSDLPNAVVVIAAGTTRLIADVDDDDFKPMDATAPRIATLACDVSMGSTHKGFFQAVSQVSPSGIDGFEDLAILDQTSSTDFLLLVCDSNETDIVIRRCVVRRSD